MGAKSSFAGSRRDMAVFALLAILLAAAAWIVGVAAGPFEADPDYIYLLNGLELLTLRSPAYYTHPGTPVEMIAAIVIAATWLVSLPLYGFSHLQDHLLAHPGFYMDGINAVLVLCIAAALVFFAFRVRTASGRLFPAVVGGLSIFLPMSAFLAVHRITPEPLLLAGGLVLAGLVAPLAFTPGAFAETKRFAMAIGTAIGFCIAVKATAAPLLIMILLLRGKGARKAALAACVLAALVLTLPVAPHYLEMALWYVALFTHQGGYGGGAVGVPGGWELLADASALVTSMPEIFVCLALYSFVIMARPAWRLPDNAVRGLTFCTIFVVVDLLLVLKQPEVRYTIPTVPFLCLGNAIVAHCLIAPGGRSRAAIIAGLAALGLWSGGARTQHLTSIRRANEALLQNVAHSGCLLAPYYGVNMVAYNLFFGDGWTKSIFKDKLARLNPGFVSNRAGALEFEDFSGRLTREAALARFARQKCVYLIGPPMARFGFANIPQNSLSLVAQTPGGPREAFAVYALKPGWNKNAGR